MSSVASGSTASPFDMSDDFIHGLLLGATITSLLILAYIIGLGLFDDWRNYR
jgi:F0F1-type ATP synthase assembly protein I